jgi:hypothetical protein
MKIRGNEVAMGKAIRAIVVFDSVVFLFFFGGILVVLREPQAAVFVGVGAAALYLPLIGLGVILHDTRKDSGHQD